MPETPSVKHLAHPGKWQVGDAGPPPVAPEPYAELQVTTNYTFLTGASHPEQLVHRAAELGYRGIAITDCNTLGGVVRGHAAAKAIGLPFAVGCMLELEAAGRLIRVLVYPTDRASYGGLCQLLTDGKRRAPKGECHLALHDLLAHEAGMLAVLIPPEDEADERFIEVAVGLAQTFGDDRLSLAATYRYGADDRSRLARDAVLAEHLGVPLVATNDVQYHDPACKPLHDVLACIREGCTLREAGHRLSPNAEQYLKPPSEMHRLFAEHPEALARSVAILERAAAFSLDSLRYEYPHETCPPGQSAMAYLTDLTWQGAAERFPDSAGGVSARVRKQIEHELELIEELDYPHYFLTVYDIVRFARSRDILCQGRGAAANSAVCYCLGVTAVDPSRIDLLFERFVSKERDEPPDIDIDFEHERREEVIQYLYERYGRSRAALTAEVITYRPRSAVREVGKALGLSLDMVDCLAKNLYWFDRHLEQPRHFRDLGIDPDDPTIQLLVRLCKQLLGFPRHRSQHVGGFVLTEQPLSHTVPIENAAMPDRTVIEWDKDDIEVLGMLKVDVLGLGMLTCVRKSFELIEQHHGRALAMHTVPPEDPAVYEMVGEADTVGVFQIESRAQMTMLPRLKPREFYDLVIEVAIVRPGPIHGGMVHPYLRRRNGEEPVTYPSEAVKGILAKTLGVPLFQEQAMQLAITAAGFTPGQADQLRRSMAAWKRKGDQIARFGQMLVEGMLANGYERDFADRCFEQIKGFSEYGFPESHAASFALIVYVSAWIKCHYPAAFAAGLINSQPMGFYAPAQIVRDAKEHEVPVLPIDVNHSRWDCTLERVAASASSPTPEAAASPGNRVAHTSEACGGKGGSGQTALRLGMRLVKGLKRDDADEVVNAALANGPFETIDQLWRGSDVSASGLRALASADAFQSMGLDRQHARWVTQRLRSEALPLFDEAERRGKMDEATHRLPPVPAHRMVTQDYNSAGLSLKAHPVSFLREGLEGIGIIPNGDLADEDLCPHGRPVRVAGLVLVRQRPSTASGIVFMTIEDETGVANLIVRPHVFERDRKAAGHGTAIIATGKVERQGRVVHVMVDRAEPIPTRDPSLVVRSRDFH